MQCHKCERKSVINLQHGALCKSHFIQYFEEKVFKTIKKYRLIDRKDILCVAVSGGKDSLAVLYLTKKYIEKNKLPNDIFALSIDEGIANYRSHTIDDLKTFCSQHKIPLKIVSFKEEFNASLDQAHPIVNKESKKKPCNICGVWRRCCGPGLPRVARRVGPSAQECVGHRH